MESTLHEKSDCQEAFNEFGYVNYCTGNLTDSNAIDHQLPSLNNSVDFLIYTISPTKAIKNKNMIHRYLQTTTITMTKIIHQFKLNIHQLV